MILKLSNTRYMKLIRKMAVMSVSLLLAAVCLPGVPRWSAEATGFDHSVVTPLVINEQKLTASDGARGHRFGFSVAISGSILVVGAEGDVLNDNTQDVVYIFERQGGSWVEMQKLTSSDGLPTHGFGFSVAVSGSTILVGAPFDAISGNNQGSVSVFERQGGSWVETQKLTGSDERPQQQFGRSIAFSGSTIVVGAPFDGNVEQGAAYVFNRQGGSWSETQKLIASDGAQLEFFGTSVAVSGSTIAVGSQRATIGSNVAQGAAYVFNRQGGSWAETQKLIASDGQANAIFGTSIALSGSTIVVGASFDTISGNAFQGSAYIFNRQGGSWSETQKLIASDGAEFSLFGSSVTLSGSTIVVGSQRATIGGNLAQGAAYVFNRQGGSWAETQKLIASDGMASDSFGSSVASSGSTIVVGAPFDTIGGNFLEGSAYVFGP